MRRAAFIIIVSLLAACAPARLAREYDANVLANLVWPPNQEPARVKFIYDFHAPEDLGFRRSFFDRAFGLFAGSKDRGMVRPYAVAADHNFIVVADPGLGVLHIFDESANKYRRIVEVDGEPLASPVGVTLAPDKIFLSDSKLGKVYALDRNGKFQFTIGNIERPTGLAFDNSANRLYVADTLRHRIDVFDVQGRAIFNFGARGDEDGAFNYPTHLNFVENQLYVNDTMNFRVQIFDARGSVLSSFGHLGDGSGDMAQPKGVAGDLNGNIYVADALFGRVQIFDSDGRFLLAIGQEGGRLGEFLLPSGIFIDRNHLFVADSYNQRVQVFEILAEEQ